MYYWSNFVLQQKIFKQKFRFELITWTLYSVAVYQGVWGVQFNFLLFKKKCSNNSECGPFCRIGTHHVDTSLCGGVPMGVTCPGFRASSPWYDPIDVPSPLLILNLPGSTQCSHSLYLLRRLQKCSGFEHFKHFLTVVFCDLLLFEVLLLAEAVSLCGDARLFGAPVGSVLLVELLVAQLSKPSSCLFTRLQYIPPAWKHK